MRAPTEIEESEVLRDVTHALGPDWRPRPCTVSLRVMDRFVGTDWFLFDEREATCESFTALEGRIRQRVAAPERARAFGSHAIAANGLRLRLPRHRGGRGAGRHFPCHQLRYVLEGSAVDGHPTYDNWVTADGDYVIVKAHVSTPKDCLYQLVELERRAARSRGSLPPWRASDRQGG